MNEPCTVFSYLFSLSFNWKLLKIQTLWYLYFVLHASCRKWPWVLIDYSIHWSIRSIWLPWCLYCSWRYFSQPCLFSSCVEQSFMRLHYASSEVCILSLRNRYRDPVCLCLAKCHWWWMRPFNGNVRIRLLMCGLVSLELTLFLLLSKENYFKSFCHCC